jgi:hypothetical protein
MLKPNLKLKEILSMNKLQSNETGFSAIEAILILVIIALLVFVGWFVWHSKQTANKTLASATQATTVSKQQAKTGSTSSTKATTDPYAGWLSLCSTSGDLCVKYPSDWKLSQSQAQTQTQSVAEYTITNPAGNVAVNYTPNSSGTGGGNTTTGAYTNNVLSLISPTATADFKVVRGLTTEYQSWLDSGKQYSYYADYLLTSNAAVQQQGLSQGTNTGSDAIAYNFTNAKSSSPQVNQNLFVTIPGNYTDSFDSLAAAQAWLNSSDVKTAGQILASVSYN